MVNIVLLMALFAAQAPNNRPPKSPTPPVQMPSTNIEIGNFEMREGAQNGAWLEERFRETLWQLDVRLHEYNGQKPRSMDAYLSSPEYSAAKKMLALRGIWKSSHDNHTWVFDAPDPPGVTTVRALELEDLSGPGGYHIRATVHCYDEADLCKAFRDRQTALLAPKPVAGSGELALRQWHNRVQTESCIVFARDMSQPRYPSQALRDGIGGTVRIGFRYNRCGNVRDAWIETSSRNRDLDHAALTEVLKWQIDTSTLPNKDKSGTAIAPVIFMVD